MSPFHFCLSAAKNLSSLQLLPASLITDLLQLFLSLPLFLFPWGFQSRAAFGTSPSSFLNVWPIHLNFLFLISKFISSPVMMVKRKAFRILVGKPLIKQAPECPRREQSSIERDPIQVCYENGRWMELAQYCLQWWTVIWGLLNLMVVCRGNGKLRGYGIAVMVNN